MGKIGKLSSVDDGDLRILRLLQENGRITNQELAQRCNMAPATCFERTRRLRESGLIQQFTAILNPAALDRSLLIFIEVVLHRTTDEAFEAFARCVRAIPDVLECHLVAGGFDYLLKVRVADMDAYRAFLGEIMLAAPGVRQTRTYAVLEEVKQTTQIPI